MWPTAVGAVRMREGVVDATFDECVGASGVSSPSDLVTDFALFADGLPLVGFGNYAGDDAVLDYVSDACGAPHVTSNMLHVGRDQLTGQDVAWLFALGHTPRTLADTCHYYGLPRPKGDGLVDRASATAHCYEALTEEAWQCSSDPRDQSAARTANGSLAGQVVCLTGDDPDGYERVLWQYLTIGCGGRIERAVRGGSTTLCVSLSDKPTGETRKAARLGIPIRTRAEYLREARATYDDLAQAMPIPEGARLTDFSGRRRARFLRSLGLPTEGRLVYKTHVPGADWADPARHPTSWRTHDVLDVVVLRSHPNATYTIFVDCRDGAAQRPMNAAALARMNQPRPMPTPASEEALRHD